MYLHVFYVLFGVVQGVLVTEARSNRCFPGRDGLPDHLGHLRGERGAGRQRPRGSVLSRVSRCKDVFDVLNFGKASAVSIVSMFHYDYVKKRQNYIENPKVGNYEFLKNEFYTQFETFPIKSAKNYLTEHNIPCRL